MAHERSVHHSGGGIVSRSGQRSGDRETDPNDSAEVMRAWRRRWTSGVAIATTRTADGGYRGITLTSVMHVSLEPPYVAFAVALDGKFAEVLRQSGVCSVQILDRDQEFLADRLAGRAPLPDASFAGVPHVVVEGLPMLTGTLAWAHGAVERIDPVGDHALCILKVTSAEVGDDTDDPLLSYEGRYRGLEAS